MKNILGKSMKAAIRQSPGKVLCNNISKPELDGNQKVLIKVLYVGICGSDIPRVMDTDNKWNGKILGHEAVGIIEEVGSEVLIKYSLKTGDKVAIIPLIPCFECYFCKRGMYSSCQHYSFIGSRVEGALSEYMLIDPKNLIKLPDDEDIQKYTFLEPLTVALHAISQTSIKLGETAVIFGAGTIGLLIMQVLRNLAYYDLIMVDIDNFKLNLAKKLGSLHNINLTYESLDQYIKKNIGSTGIDVVFEVSGATTAKQNAIQITQPGGSIVLIGTSHHDIIFDGPTFELITRKELKLIGSWMSYSNPFPGSEWQAGVKILQSNLLDIKSIVTHSYKLDEIETAFNMILKNTEKYCKVMINI